ncbi:carboxymuconolactone decarboxylase family protein [Variovorax sp. J22R133]|uniref:carboxymuconolactone decarboxylase family protein n=1 Tax=Variovorax brevis TaxID=3053503 RepID=UPI002578E305|nr:carboxymuconolactone decarboxylase family protein [Variovorax sp. J22R133]MDM0117039.1 carboxymuconolactone decarboxylase family protein [Variovorax sp. J22R133]
MPNIDYCNVDDPEIAELVATIRKRRSTGKLLNLDRMLLHSPHFARGWNSMFAAIRNQLQVPRHINELAICAVARLNEADYEWIQHAPEFLAANGTQAQLDALDDVTAACYDTALFNEQERVALRLTLDMTRQVKVRKEIIEKARQLFGEQQLVELMGTIAGYNMVSRFLVVLDIDATGE